MEILGGLVVLSVMILLSGIKVVKDSNRLVVYRMGRVVATKGAGVHLIVPILESAETVDTRVMMLDTPLVTASTLDHHTIDVSAACMFQIGDVKRAVTKIANAPEATATLAATVLRNVIGQNDLKTLQSEQKGVNKKLKTMMEKQCREWGVQIKSIEIKSLAVQPAAPAIQAAGQGAIERAAEPTIESLIKQLDQAEAAAAPAESGAQAS